MVNIGVNNSYSKLFNVDRETAHRIKQLLRYPNPEFGFGVRQERWKYLFSESTRTFPTGLLGIVERFFIAQQMQYKITDYRLRPSSDKILRLYKPMPDLRPYQNSCMEISENKERGTLCLATGLGKTLLATKIIREKSVSTLFVCPGLSLTEQTFDIFEEYYSSKMVGKHDKPKFITVANYQSLASKPKAYFDEFQMVIIDEAHHSAAETLYTLSLDKLDKIFYRYFLSATPYRNDGTDLKLQAVIGDIIFNYPAAQAVKDGWIAYPFFFIYNVYNENLRKGDNFREEYVSHIVENVERNKLIESVARNLSSKGRHILILVREIAHGEKLAELLGDCSLFIRGESDKDGIRHNKKVMASFKEKKFPILIATGVIGEGTDINTIDTVVNAAGYKARSDVIQKVGRALRILSNKDYALVIDFNDKNGNYVTDHSLERLNHYSEYETQLKVMDYEN